MAAGNSTMWTVLGVIAVVLLILFANWWWQDRTVKLYNGFWQYGLMTDPGTGCTGTPSACDPDATFKTYAPFYYTALAAGGVDPAYNDQNKAGSQQNLQVGNQTANYLIAPLDGQGDAKFYQWRFRNSYTNSVAALFRLSSPQYQLYNEGLQQYLVPVAGDFPQGKVPGWGPASDTNTSASPPGWLAHNFYKTQPAPDYKTIFPSYWKYGQYFIPNATSGAPEGHDPDEGKQISGMNVLVCCVWFPKTAGSSSDGGAWFEYFADVGAGSSGDTYQLGGPVNLNLGTIGSFNSQLNSRFMAGYYMNMDTPVNQQSYITKLAGGSVPATTPNKGTTCYNGKQSGSDCACSGAAFGFNCLYPSPSKLTVSSQNPPHKYSPSSSSAVSAPMPARMPRPTAYQSMRDWDGY